MQLQDGAIPAHWQSLDKGKHLSFDGGEQMKSSMKSLLRQRAAASRIANGHSVTESIPRLCFRKTGGLHWRVSATIYLAGALTAATLNPVNAADQFRRLKGAEIRARLAGMELTDGVHWTYIFRLGGRVTSIDLGKRVEGSWSVRKDELCIKVADLPSPCSQVWAAGQRIQLRRGDELPEDATLQAPQKRT